MTITATDLDVRAMSLDQLADAYSDAGDSMAKAIRAECARRDRAEQAARKREAIRSEWHDFAYQDYLAAEAECRGELVSREGVQAGVRDGFQLWAGPRAIAEKYASEELRDWWLLHPRITIGDYERQRAAAERTAREDTTTEEAGNGDRVGTDGRDGLDGDDAGAVRDGDGTGAGQPVRACRDDGQAEARPAAGPVQPAAVSGEGVTMETTKDGAEAVTETEVKAPAAPALNGAEVLDETERFFRRFAVLPSSHAYVAVALWAAMTHAFQAFDCAPRLALLSNEPASGKTRVLDLLTLVVAKPEPMFDMTGPALFSLISTEHPTVLFDEADQFFGRGGGGGKRNVTAILNVGYRRGASVLRMERGAPVRYDVYSPAAFAGLGKLPDTIGSRCVKVKMRRRKAGETCDRYIPRYHVPLGQEHSKSLSAWATSVGAELATAEPELPEDVEDRAAELWWPLLSIADAAGGSWPARAREACVALLRGDSAGEKDSLPPAQQLLADLGKVWAADADRMPTADLVRGLLELPGAPWAGMWTPMTAPREMAALLEPHGVKPVKIRVGDRTAQGYYRPAQLPEPAAEPEAEMAGV